MNIPKEEPDRRASNSAATPTIADDARYLNLETYRRNGVGVRTPVWFAACSNDADSVGMPKFYVYTTADSGKAKRVRRDGAVRIAACDMRGNLTGPWINARAEVVAGEEFQLGMRLLNRKYFPWKQLLGLSAQLFRYRKRVVLAIRPTLTDGPCFGGTRPDCSGDGE
jgi:uncharacterized protein